MKHITTFDTGARLLKLDVGAIRTNCYIYESGADCFVIDPGDCAQDIVSAAKEAQMSINYIILTHGHFDHMSAVGDLKKNYPLAKIAVHKDDAHYLGASALQYHLEDCRLFMGNEDLVRALWKEAPPAPDILLEEGMTLGSLTVLHTPGHSAGSVCYHDKAAKVLFSGDTLFAHGTGRTDLPGGSEAALMKSLERLAALKDYALYPGHDY